MKRQTIVSRAGKVFIAGSVILGLWVASNAFAEPQGPCAGDVATFCKGVEPGQGRIIKCMKEHENDLSPMCKEHIAQMKQKAGEAREACADDVTRFCNGVQPGGGRLIRCLKGHESDLSPQCKEAMQERRQRKGQ